MEAILPKDLHEFLKEKKQLKADWEQTETGVITLKALEDLRISYVYVAPTPRKAPHKKSEGVYRVTAINLIASCERYSPNHLLTYLPFEQAFAAFDGDHARVTVFPGATWSDISASPEPYLNSLWEQKPKVKAEREIQPWKRYEFFPEEFW